MLKTSGNSKKCSQLKRLLRTQEAKLEEAESKLRRDELDIQNIRNAIKNTKEKLVECGC